MGIPNLFPLLVMMQLLNTNNVQSFCESWHRRTKEPCRIGIDASAVIHTMLRKHKNSLLLDGSRIDKCPHFRKSLITCISDMKKWATGNVFLHFICDGSLSLSISLSLSFSLSLITVYLYCPLFSHNVSNVYAPQLHPTPTPPCHNQSFNMHADNSRPVTSIKLTILPFNRTPIAIASLRGTPYYADDSRSVWSALRAGGPRGKTACGDIRC